MLAIAIFRVQPQGLVSRVEKAWRQGGAYQGTAIPQSCLSACDRLHQRISKRGRFDRPGEHRPLSGVCGRLIQIVIAGSATDDVDAADAIAGEPLERVGGRTRGAMRLRAKAML